MESPEARALVGPGQELERVAFDPNDGRPVPPGWAAVARSHGSHCDRAGATAAALATAEAASAARSSQPR